MRLLKYFSRAFAAMALFLVLSACADDTVTVSGDAELIDEPTIKKTPGFMEWYQEVLDTTVTDQDIISEIKTTFDNQAHRLILFVSPCGYCVGDQSDFARMMKVIIDANIPTAKYELYSIKNANYHHPYDAREDFNLYFLPSCFILRNEKVVYSVADTIQKYQYIDSTKIKSFEEMILDGLKQQ